MPKLLFGAHSRHDQPPLADVDVQLLLRWLAKIPDTALVRVQLVRRLLAALDARRHVRPL